MKRVIASFLLMSILLYIPGCRSYGSGKSSASSLEQPSLSDNTTHTAPIVNDLDYRIAARPDVITRGSSSDKGFFQIFSHTDGHSNLMFIDYATAQQVFVCSSPSCNHKDETCSSYIESDGYTVFPAVYGNTILLVYNSLNQWGNAPQASKIEKMDINGLDRKLLCTFSGNILINDGAVVGDGRIILCATKLLSNAENIGTVPCLLSIDIGTGECSDLYQVKTGNGEMQKSLFIRGVSESGFILKTITINEYEESDDAGIAMQNMQNATVHRVFELSFDGQREKELLRYTGSTCFEEYSGRELVYLSFDKNTCSLYKINSVTGQKEIIIKDFDTVPSIRKTEVPLTSENFFIVGFIDDYVLINQLYQEHYDAQKNIELLYPQYAVNTETGEVIEITLSNYLMATRKPINIIAQFSDTLLVDAVEEVVDGITYRRPGMISVDDYLKSKGEYIMIEQLLEEKLS